MSFERVERQIAMLREYPTIDVGEMMLRRDAADTMQALLDVVVAAEQHVAEWDDADATLQEALDKLREVGDEP